MDINLWELTSSNLEFVLLQSDYADAHYKTVFHYWSVNEYQTLLLSTINSKIKTEAYKKGLPNMQVHQISLSF